MTLEVLAPLLVPVGLAAIPPKQPGARQVAAQVAEEAQNVGAADVLLGVQSQIEVDATAVRRDD